MSPQCGAFRVKLRVVHHGAVGEMLLGEGLGLTELEATRIAEANPGSIIEHQNPDTQEWERW